MDYNKRLEISIHALRGEGDLLVGHIARCYAISIHALRGEGDTVFMTFALIFTPFQSTPSVGRATWSALPSALMELLFQSTPSVGRATGIALYGHILRVYFNPRPPWGGRQDTKTKKTSKKDISIHALRGEGDCKNIQICNAMLVHSAYKTIYFCDSCAFYLT